MVLRLSDLVQKSIDKGYGAASQPIEKPWTQGNLSMIDLKTGNNPFIKSTAAPCINQDKPLQPSREIVHQEQPVLHSSHASLKKQTTNKQPPPDAKWWEKISFAEPGESSSPRGRLLVNYALLKEEDYA